mgnify:CR=1 FL=1
MLVFLVFLAGTCKKNVGFYNAHVEAATNSGAGVIGGYIGVKAPNAVEKDRAGGKLLRLRKK